MKYGSGFGNGIHVDSVCRSGGADVVVERGLGGDGFGVFSAPH